MKGKWSEWGGKDHLPIKGKNPTTWDVPKRSVSRKQKSFHVTINKPP